MKNLYIIGNWKSNKTIQETEEWIHAFSEWSKDINVEGKEVIICPPFTTIEHFRYCHSKLGLPITLGVQNISPFPNGPYTGEVSAEQASELASYAIIGHSERRKYLGETDKLVHEKVALAIQYDLIPILCISNLDQLPTNNHEPITNNYIVAYEPLFAISTSGIGQPDSPENAEQMAKKIKERLGGMSVLYGGSVTGENVHGFTSKTDIDGVLVGAASLDADEFTKIIINA